MQRTFTISTLLVSLIALAGANAAVAQTGPQEYQVGFRLGGSLGISDDWDERSDADISYIGFATGPITGPLGWRIEGGQDRFKGSDALRESCEFFQAGCGDPRITRFNGGLQLTGHGGIISFYGYVTGGAYRIDPGGTFIDDEETEFGMSYGGGLNVNIGPTLFLGADLAFNTFFPGDFGGFDEESQTYFVPSFQVGARF